MFIQLDYLKYLEIDPDFQKNNNNNYLNENVNNLIDNISNISINFENNLNNKNFFYSIKNLFKNRCGYI